MAYTTYMELTQTAVLTLFDFQPLQSALELQRLNWLAYVKAIGQKRDHSVLFQNVPYAFYDCARTNLYNVGDHNAHMNIGDLKRCPTCWTITPEKHDDFGDYEWIDCPTCGITALCPFVTAPSWYINRKLVAEYGVSSFRCDICRRCDKADEVCIEERYRALDVA